MTSPSSTSIPSPNPSSPAWSIYLDNQSFNLTTLDGSETTLNLSIVNAQTYQIGLVNAIYGITIGATAVTLIVVFIFADATKMRKPLFILNTLSLIIQFFRGVLSVAMALQLS